MKDAPSPLPAGASQEALNIQTLPQLAGFIRRNALDEWCDVYRENAAVAGLNPEEYFPSPDELRATMARLMASVEQGHFEKYMADSIAIMFAAEGTGMIEQRATEITRLNYVRKRTLLHFAKAFARDVASLHQLVGEIDDFNFAFEQAIQTRVLETIRKSATEADAARKKLELREAQLLEAQRLTCIGSFVWNTKTMQSEVTPELLAILEIDTPHDFHGFMDKVHTDDKPQLEASLAAALLHFAPYDSTYRYRGSKGEKILRSRGIVNLADDGVKVMTGTVMDVTEQQNLINSLENSKALYKVAQRIGKIGNWRLDVATGAVEWSEEVFRIYGLEPREATLSLEEINSYFHPDDVPRVDQMIAAAMENGKESFTDISRIITPGSVVKILEVTGHITRDGAGTPLSIFGTIQDITAERTLIENLQQATSLYRRMETMANIGTWSYDIADNIVHWSDELYRIYGVTPTDAPVDYETARLLTDEPYRSQNGKLIQKCIEDGTPYDTLGYMTLKDGSRKIIRGKGEAVKDVTGKVIRLFGTLQDITAQEALSEKLRQSEERLRQAQAMAHIGSGVFYVDSGRSSWSDELYNIFEVERDADLSYATIQSLLLPKEWELMELHVRRCVESGVRFDFHGHLAFKDGRMKHVRIIGEPQKRVNGLTQEIFCTVQDVTELRAIEQRLRENQRFSQKITDVTPAVIAVLNVQNGTYKMVSPMAETIFGYSPDTILTGNFEWLAGQVHPDDLAGLLAENTNAVERANGGDPAYSDEEIIEFRYRIRHKDGVFRYVQTSAIIFDRDEAGKVLHVLNVTIDISQLMAAEEKLRAANATLQQSNSSLQEFAYIASHDLQEPLRKISTFGTMIEGMEAELPERGKMYIRKMVESAQRMQGMINDILAVSTIAGEQAFEKCSLHTLLEEAMMPLDHKTEETGAAINIPEPLPQARVVPAQMRQLFQNLLSNSLKFTKKDRPPVIDITWRMVPGSETNVHGLDAESTYIAMSFTDNGIGFSNEYAGRIFAIFQRLNGKTEYEGSGIGLAICKKIAEHHNGAISASSMPDEGTTFTILLPALGN